MLPDLLLAPSCHPAGRHSVVTIQQTRGASCTADACRTSALASPASRSSWFDLDSCVSWLSHHGLATVSDWDPAGSVGWLVSQPQYDTYRSLQKSPAKHGGGGCGGWEGVGCKAFNATLSLSSNIEKGKIINIVLGNRKEQLSSCKPKDAVKNMFFCPF